MSLPAWPAGLNHRSELHAWSATPTRGPREIEMERGNVRQERRPGARRGEYAWARTLTAAELVVWEDFLADIEDGTARFSMLVAIRGSAYDTREVEIVAGSLAYATAPGGRTTVSFRLRVYPSGAAGAVLASAEWPASLPYLPSRSGWGGAPVATWRETEIEDGAVRSAHRPWSRVARWSWAAEFSAAEMETFVAFLDQIGQGAARYWMPVALGGGRVEIRRVQMVAGSIKYVQAGDGFTNVSMELRVYPAGLVPPVPVITSISGSTIAGTAKAGATVEVLIGSLSLFTTAAGGVWSVAIPWQVDGTYTVLARATVSGSVGPWCVPASLTMPTPRIRALRARTLGRPALTMDFLNEDALREGVSSSYGPWQSISGVSFLRGGVATNFNAAGNLVEAPANTPRIFHDPVTLQKRGLLIENAQANQIRNSTMVGAGPGVPPTGWAAPSSTASGVVVTCAGSGIENGINYTDWDVVGTATSSGSLLLFCFGSSSNMPATPGQAWSIATYCSLVSGSLTGTRWTGQPNGLFIFAYNASFGFLNGPSSEFTPSVGPLRERRVYNENWAAPANTVYMAQAIRAEITNGATIGMRLRVGLPFQTSNAVAGMPVKTINAAASRAGESLTIPVTSLPYNASEGTFVVSAWTPTTVLATASGLMQLDDGDGTNRITFGMGGNAVRRVFAQIRTAVGYSLNVTSGPTITPGARFRGVMTWRSDGTGAIAVNGSDAVEFSGLVIPTVTRLSTGAGPSLNAFGGPFEDSTYIGAGVSNAEAKALSA